LSTRSLENIDYFFLEMTDPVFFINFVPLVLRCKKIVRAHQVLEDVYRTTYPFATSKILTDGKEVLFKGEVGDIIRADETLQITIKEILEPYCKKIAFNDDSLAKRFYPFGRDSEIVIDLMGNLGNQS
jgi:hypothetical protein